MEEEVEAVDSLLKRNDFNLQVMATPSQPSPSQPNSHLHRPHTPLTKATSARTQVMATVPALALSVCLLLVIRSGWRRLRGSDSARRD